MRRKKSARKPSTKRNVTIIVLLLILFSSVAVGMFGRNRSYTPPEASWITFADPGNMSDAAQAAIIRAAQLWTATYGPCPQSVSITTMPLEMKGEDYVLDRTTPGHMDIVPDQYVYDTALHAFTHACAGSLRPVVPVPFREGDIIGFRGLGINVLLTGGEVNYYMMIEEGVAERNAYCADALFNPGTESYQRLMALSLMLFPCGDDTVVMFLKTSDVSGLLAYILNKPPDRVVMGDVTDLMDIYMEAYLGQ